MSYTTQVGNTVATARTAWAASGYDTGCGGAFVNLGPGGESSVITAERYVPCTGMTVTTGCALDESVIDTIVDYDSAFTRTTHVPWGTYSGGLTPVWRVLFDGDADTGLAAAAPSVQLEIRFTAPQTVSRVQLLQERSSFYSVGPDAGSWSASEWKVSARDPSTGLYTEVGHVYTYSESTGVSFDPVTCDRLQLQEVADASPDWGGSPLPWGIYSLTIFTSC